MSPPMVRKIPRNPLPVKYDITPNRSAGTPKITSTFTTTRIFMSRTMRASPTTFPICKKVKLILLLIDWVKDCFSQMIKNGVKIVKTPMIKEMME